MSPVARIFVVENPSVNAEVARPVPQRRHQESDQNSNSSPEEYVRRVFIILSIVMVLTIAFSCAFMFSNARDQIRYNRNYYIVVGSLFVIFPFVCFIIRSFRDEEKTSKYLRWICMVPSHLMVILIGAGLCCADLREFMFLSTLGCICIFFIVMALYGSQITHTIWKGLLVVFITHLILGVILIPSVWLGFGKYQGVSVIGAVFISAAFCLFAIYDVMRLSKEVNPFCFKDWIPLRRDFVWDSVQVFLEFVVFCIIACIVCAVICILIACVILGKATKGKTLSTSLAVEVPLE